MTEIMLGLRSTIYNVPNLSDAKSWYAKAFKVEPYFDEPFYVGFNIKGYELGLLSDEAESRPLSDNVLSYWGVKDIQKEYDRFVRLGAVSHEAPTNVGGELMVASVRDPWGNVIGLIYNPHFKLE
jgi:lactoylglutathione lyase